MDLNKLFKEMNQARDEIGVPKKEEKEIRPTQIIFGDFPGGLEGNKNSNAGSENNRNNINGLNNRNNNEEDRDNNIIMKYQPPKDDPFFYPEIIPKLKNVALLVKNIYYEVYPEKVGEYPKGYVEGVIRDYEKIRTLRYTEMKKSEKSNDKFGLKGLRSSAIVAVLMYCSFIGDNNPIPAPVYLHIVNNAMKRKGFRAVKKKIPREKDYIWHGKKKGIPKVTKWKPPKENKPNKENKPKKPDMDFSTVSMKMFEDYRTSDKKGIKKYIMRLSIGKQCYRNKVRPMMFVHFMGRKRMQFSEKLINETKKLCDEVEKKKIIDPKTVPSGTIALAVMLFMAVKNGLHVTKEMYGIPNIPEVTLLRFYRDVAKSNIIEHNVPLDPFKEAKPMKQAKPVKQVQQVKKDKKSPVKVKSPSVKPKQVKKRVPQEDYKILVEE